MAVPRMQRVAGVREVLVAGGTAAEVVIDPDARKLAAAGLTVQSIASALEGSGAVVAAGTVTDGVESLSVQAGSPLESVEELRRLPLIGQPPPAAGAGSGRTPAAAQPAPTPGVVELRDVAQVSLEPEPRTSVTRTNGRESVSLSITKVPDGDSVAISHAINELIPQLERDLGDGTAIDVVFDQAPFVERSIEDLRQRVCSASASPSR